MRKLLLSFIATFCCMSISAQSLQLYKDGVVIKEYSKAEVDSIVFKEALANAHEYVDLGLPSGTLWATCNVGANSPEEYGLYFAWGETTGYTSDTSDGRSFNWASYKLCNGAFFTSTKYCTSSRWGTVDNKTELDPEDDAATANWGKEWQMPSFDQIEELYNSSYTITTWTTQRGVKGRLITSQKNGNSLFLPAAGYRAGISLDYEDYSGYYWTRSLGDVNSDGAFSFYFDSYDIRYYNFNRCGAESVRPVRVSE